jgi:hypothetical protein
MLVQELSVGYVSVSTAGGPYTGPIYETMS